MKKLLEEYCQNQCDPGLLLLSMPTGSGKTHQVLNFIHTHYKEFAAQNRKMLFVTNLKKNLPVEDLKKRFETEGQETEFDRHVLFIDSNAESVINHLLQIDHEVPDQFKTENYTKLKSYIETLSHTKQLPKTVKSSLESEIRKNLEPSFRRFVTEVLHKGFKTKKERLTAIKHDPHYQWIGKLYPAVYTDERTVLFLSMDKFIRQNTTLIERSYYFFEHLVDKAVIFIDEFDATKETILQNIIESGMRHRVNLLDLFLNIHNHLMQSECPEGLLKESEGRKQEAQFSNKNWPSLHEIVASFQEKANQIFTTYKLQHACKSHEDFSGNRRNFLFYDYQFHHVLDARNRRIEIIEDAKSRANWIKAVDAGIKDSGVNIRSMLSDIAGFLVYFQRGIGFLADNYCHLKEEDASIQETFPLESAIRTVLNHFRLDSLDVEFLTRNIMESEMLYGLRSYKKATQGQHFYDTGFRYYDIVDSDEHDTLSKIYMFNFIRTPESFLADVCLRAKVIGISATAGLYTNIGNYDLEYLKSRLGDLFIHLNNDTLARLKETFTKTTQGYEKLCIKTEFIGESLRDGIDETIEQLEIILNDHEAAQALWNHLQHTATEDSENAVGFVFCRYVRALTAWKYFLDHLDCSAFLCLFNKLPKLGDSQFDLKLLYEYGSLLLDENQKDEKIEDTIVVLSGDGFEENKAQLLNDLKNGNRRFIISAYQTIGAGQNLQFPIPNNVEPIHINDYPQRNEMDINGIYLDRPTNLIVNIFNDTIEESNFIKYLFQLEFLIENGAISLKTFKDKLDEAFHRYVGRHKPKRSVEDFLNLYQTDAYTRFLNKVIIQAVGRICRTNMKAPTIHILADASIRKHLTQFVLPEDVIPVREYAALLKSAEESVKQSDDFTEFQNRASVRSNRTSAYINSQLNTPWTQERVEAWQALRDQTLRYPVITDQSECESGWNGIYLQLPKPAYSYRYSEAYDYRDIEVFFSTDQGAHEVSARTARLPELMNIDILHQLFLTSGWATDFPISEWMLTPPLFNNIYKGALGEVCGKHILQTLLEVDLQELSMSEFESFDFKMNQGIYIDFKLWNDRIGIPADKLTDKIREKMDKIGAKQVFIINILGTESENFRPIISSDKKIIEIPFLCTQGSIDDSALTFLYGEFCKCTSKQIA